MRKIAILVALLISVLFLYQMSHAELLVADDFEGKLKNKYWKGQDESWKVKGGKLEIHRLAGDGNGEVDFGYGLIDFEDFGLRLDFYLFDDDDFPSKMELLFRANIDYHFYQLIITPANGFGRPNSARWYKREGNDRGTWNEYRDFRAEFPFPILTKEWYTLALLGNANTFQLHVKKQGELVFQKVSEWTDVKNLHPKGVLGFHTNQLQHYYIDNLYLYDQPNEVSLAVEPYGKLAVTWAALKQ